MARNLLLYTPPLALRFASPPPALALTGTLPKYFTDVAYEGRLQIANNIGDCTAELISGDLPPGHVIWVDQATDEVVIEWPAFELDAEAIPNGDFEQGDVAWAKGAGWTIEQLPVDGEGGGTATTSGTWAAIYRGRGESLLTSVPVAVLPGASINASIDIKQGGSSAGSVVGWIRLNWYDVIGNPLPGGEGIGYVSGNVISSGNNGAWHPSQVTAVAPPLAAFVSVSVVGNRIRQDKLLRADTATWTHTYDTGAHGDVDYPITIRVHDSAGRTADWSGVIEHGIPIPTVVGLTKYAPAGTATSWPVPMPAGIVAGDELLIFLTRRSASSSPTAPSGWTLDTTLSGSGTNSQWHSVYRRTATGSEGATVTITGTSATSSSAMCLAVRGASSTIASAINPDTGSGAPPDAGPLTVSNGATTLWAVVALGRVMTTAPTSYPLAENQDWITGPTGNPQQGIYFCAQSGHTSNTLDPAPFGGIGLLARTLTLGFAVGP